MTRDDGDLGDPITGSPDHQITRFSGII